MRLGIMGGTFDPIHFGHLFVAEEARIKFSLDRVIFIPNGRPPHKDTEGMTAAHHRYNMAVRAIEHNAGFVCSDIEIRSPAVGYTCDTLAHLTQEYPDSELYYLTGVDAIADIMNWRKPLLVLSLARFIVASRPGWDPETFRRELPEEFHERIIPMESTWLAISSTDIRKRIMTGAASRYLLPDTVHEYIIENGLYGSRDSYALHGSRQPAPAEGTR